MTARKKRDTTQELRDELERVRGDRAIAMSERDNARLETASARDLLTAFALTARAAELFILAGDDETALRILSALETPLVARLQRRPGEPKLS